MAAPIYTTDLQIYNDCTDATGWDELIGMTLSAPPDIDTDLAIHGTICITSDRAKIGLSSNAYVGAGFTLAAGECVFLWHKFFAPNSLSTLANGGVRVMIGDSSSVYDGWYMDGSDTYPYGGWVNYVVDPTITPDQTAGTTTGTYAMVGNGWNLPTQAPQKGNPFGTDIIRYGRGESRFTEGESANPAVFSGFVAVNDHPSATTGRLGLLQDNGGSLLFKGLMLLGTGGTAVYFVDNSINISIDNTLKVSREFNRIEIHDTGSTVSWTAINITALGTGSTGQFEMVDNCDVTMDTCVFTDMDTFIFKTGATGITNTSFIRCSGVTQNSATFDGCTFDESKDAVSLYVEKLPNITNSSFISDGSNHAMELDVNHSGGTYTLIGCTYENYATVSGSTGNECIYNNSSGHTIINISGGDTPTIRNGTGASTEIKNDTVMTITGLKDNTEIRVYDNATLNPQIELAGIEDATNGTTDNRSFTFSLPASTVVDIVYHNKLYESIPPRSIGYVIPSSTTSISIVQLSDPNYNGDGS